MRRESGNLLYRQNVAFRMVMVMFYFLDRTVAVFCFTAYQEATMQPSSNFILTKAERQLIELIRSIDYGELRIMVKDEKPIRVEEIRRSIQLQSEK